MIDPRERRPAGVGKLAEAARQLNEYLYRARQVYDHTYQSNLPKRWWPAFLLLDDMCHHLPMLVHYLEMALAEDERSEEMEWPESLIEWEEQEGRPTRAPRAFTADQKRDLWFKAGGRCSICRVVLQTDWHADHVVPWSAGGDTTTDNGQALCPPCNHRKHAREYPSKL